MFKRWKRAKRSSFLNWMSTRVLTKAQGTITMGAIHFWAANILMETHAGPQLAGFGRSTLQHGGRRFEKESAHYKPSAVHEKGICSLGKTT